MKIRFRWDLVGLVVTLLWLFFLIIFPFMFPVEHRMWYVIGYIVVFIITIGFMPGWTDYLNYLDGYYTYKRWEQK